ncbi:uncharacterized protein PAC_19812 [Phialocephala subalpina]|uniref:Uncharacterized protein n=1 Tax=Phialocephala subalpina TaxID=576137 RepID=A0A1L7XXV8_9HELO|nr:uncharacterized protein PAC_19812 [Phialocephala subalpina]
MASTAAKPSELSVSGTESNAIIAGRQTIALKNATRRIYHCTQLRDVPQTRPARVLEGSGADTAHRNAILALLLPENSDTPRLVWIHARQYMDHEGNFFKQSTVHKDITESYKMNPAITRDITRKGRCLRLFMCENKASNGNQNSCLRYLSQGYTASDSGNIYRGNIIVCAFVVSLQPANNDGSVMREETTYVDIDCADLRHTLNVLVQGSLYDSLIPNNFIVRQFQDWVPAVKINCDGDVKLKGKRKYQDVYINRWSHKIYGPLSTETHSRDLHPDVSTISQNMGMTLRVQKIIVDSFWGENMATSTEPHTGENTAAKFLMTDTDIENKRGVWGTVMAKWNTGVDVTALVASDVLAPLLRKSEGTDSKLQREGFVHDYLRSGRFEAFFEEFKMKRRSAGGDETFTGVPPVRKP